MIDGNAYYVIEKFREVKKELGLHKDYTLYSTKHTSAMAMAKRNVPPYAMMKFFRHSSLDITMHYLKDLGLDVSREAVIGYEQEIIL